MPPRNINALRIGSTHVGFNSYDFGDVDYRGDPEAIGHVAPMAEISMTMEKGATRFIVKVGGLGFPVSGDTFDAIVNILAGKMGDGSPIPK